MQPEQKLWQAVIMQAVLDYLTASKKPDDVFGRDGARRWIDDRPPSFIFVCDMAGIHPDMVARAIKSEIHRRHTGGTRVLDMKIREKKRGK